MTHLDDDSDNDSFLYDKEVYDPESELATNAFYAQCAPTYSFYRNFGTLA
jgi:hypothetical protein